MFRFAFLWGCALLPQLIFLAGCMLALGWALGNDGKTGQISFGWELLNHALVHALLWWGGFYDCFLGK